jgi:hypothetical protein
MDTRTTYMKCPQCQTDSIPFGKIWLKSGFGTYRCPNCNALCRVRRSNWLFVVCLCLGGAASGLGLWSRSWLVFGAAVFVAVLLDALIDFRFRRLELIAKEQ